MKGYVKRLMVLTLALMFVLGGCAKGDDKGTTSAGGTTEAPTEAETLAPPVVIEDITEYVTLGQYKGVEVVKESAEVTEKDIEDAINSVLDYCTDYEQIKEGTVAEGDTVGIDYVGKLDGVAFEGGTGSSDLEIGSGSFIDGFEEGLIGVKIGETVDLNLTFPEVYERNPDLAGKAVVFTVTVNYKLGTEKVRPEFDQELAEKLDFDSVEEMRENIVKTVTEQKKSEVESDYIMNIWDTVIKNCEIKKHDGIYNEYYDNFISQYESMAAQYGTTLENLIKNYYGMEYEEFEKYAVEYATACMNQELVCRAIAVNEKMAVTDEEYAEALAEYFKEYSSHFEDEAALETFYGKDRLKNDILLQNSIDLVIDNAVAVEPSDEETTGAAGDSGETSTNPE